MKKTYDRPAFLGLTELDAEPRLKLLLGTIFLFGEYFQPMRIIPMVMACDLPSKSKAVVA